MLFMKNRKRNRKQGFDYSCDNLYFVTICVQNRICCLGSVIFDVVVETGRKLSVRNSDEIHSNELHKRMELNNFGKIVYDRIMWLEEQYEYVILHSFVVMPNHVHIIVEIDRLILQQNESDSSEPSEGIKIKSLSSLIGAFKTTSSKMIHQEGFLDFAWQRSFHDHIIRNEKSYLNICNYIVSNPEKWAVDTFFKKD